MNHGPSIGHVPEPSEQKSIDNSLDNACKLTKSSTKVKCAGASIVGRDVIESEHVDDATVTDCVYRSRGVTQKLLKSKTGEKAPDNGMNVLAFSRLLGTLKHLPRTGWLRHEIKPCEPVAGHMYRMAVLAMCVDRADLDQAKCIKMALVHDVAESLVGDITPHCGVSPEEKIRRENEGMKHIASLLPPRLGTEIYSLWREYEAQTTEESRLVKQLDKFDLIMQAYEYEQQAGKPKFLQEFFNANSTSINQEPVTSWMKELIEERNKVTQSADLDKIDKQDSIKKSDQRKFE